MDTHENNVLFITIQGNSPENAAFLRSEFVPPIKVWIKEPNLFPIFSAEDFSSSLIMIFPHEFFPKISNLLIDSGLNDDVFRTIFLN